MTIYVKDVPDELHRRFKALAASRGESIKAAILRVMEEEIQRGQKGGARK